jgi:hypothetical protein
MRRQDEWQSRIKAVEREYLAMRQAADHFRQDARLDPSILHKDLRPREIDEASEKLEGTYVIRLFAEFESGARQYWAANRDTNPRTADLLEGLAAMCKVPDTLVSDVHSVREYRNGLVHEREDKPEVVPIDKARGFLCRFFSFLPPQW